MTDGPDWLIEAARRPVVRCSHDFSEPHMFCTFCHRSAEDIHNEDRTESVRHGDGSRHLTLEEMGISPQMVIISERTKIIRVP